MNRIPAIILIIILLPVWVLIAFIQLLTFRKVIFQQRRTGEDASLFTMYKFQTMTSNSGRIPLWGAFLRKTSLDETPQLINVLLGQMNFVGPRPLLPEYFPLYSPYQNQRHTIKPGITGWAQVNGRKDLSWEKQFEYDVWYVKNQNLLLDIKIIALTFLKVLDFKKNKEERKPFSGNKGNG